MKTKKEVETYLKHFLPPHNVTHCETKKHNILNLPFQISTVGAQLKDGKEIFAISSSMDDAISECLKKYALHARKTELIEGPPYKYCLANGVGIHPDFQRASQDAYLELFERNEILKSWYYNTPVRRIPFNASDEFTSDFTSQYDLVMVDFSTKSTCHVLGLFGFPKSREFNLIYGFGTALTLQESTLKAKKEFIKRLGTLTGENPQSGHLDKKSGLYHQNFYLMPENCNLISEWVLDHKLEKKKCSMFLAGKPKFLDITPESWKPQLHVVKSSCSDLIPLFFGGPPLEIFDFECRCDIPHPICQN
ncbi:MAG TPA: YcaO-like family protein [Bacteriovoracaceae bacterium]|nr:YcaO-like family protein [Bacteriovoracaceae bacterium]